MIRDRDKHDLLVGEILGQTGSSKRELQALDQLGLFNRQAQTNQGICRYDLHSMMLIEQFEFYTMQGLPMEAVREFLGALVCKNSLQPWMPRACCCTPGWMPCKPRWRLCRLPRTCIRPAKTRLGAR